MSFITGGNTIIKENLLAKEVTKLLDKKFVVMPWANKKYENEIKQQGDTISIETFPNIAWSSGTTAGATISATAFTITKDQLVINQLATFRADVTNVEAIQSNLNLREEIAGRMAYWQAEVLEKYLIKTAVEWAHASNVLGSLAVSLTTATVYGAIDSIRVALSRQNAFEQAGLFVDPVISSLLRQSTNFDGFREGLDVRMEWYIGKMSGFQIFETNNLGYKQILAFDRNAVHFAAQWTGFKVTNDPTAFVDHILGEMAYDAKVCTENKKRIAIYAYANA